jgi:Rap1a immunity proteins
MRRSAIVTLMLATLASVNHGHAEENRGSADYLLPLCKTWLDFAEKEVETVKDLGRTEPIRLTAAGMCAGFVVGVLETLRSNKQSCPPKDLSNPQIVRTVVSEVEKHPDRMHEEFVRPARAVIMESWPCHNKKGPHRIGSAKR